MLPERGFATSVANTLPEQLTANQSEHIGILPTGQGIDAYNENVVIRYFPAAHHNLPELTAAKAQQTIEEGCEQFELLSKFDIDVPKIVFAHAHPDAPHTRIVSIVERVEGATFGNYWLWPAMGARAPHQDEALKLASGLVKYFASVLEKTPNTFLSDIAEPHQYMITAEGRVVLVDTDPYLTPTFPLEATANDLETQLSNLEAWARFIQRPEAVEDILEQISALKEDYRRAQLTHPRSQASSGVITDLMPTVTEDRLNAGSVEDIGAAIVIGTVAIQDILDELAHRDILQDSQDKLTHITQGSTNANLLNIPGQLAEAQTHLDNARDSLKASVKDLTFYANNFLK